MDDVSGNSKEIRELKDQIRQNELRIDQLQKAFGDLQGKIGMMELFLMASPFVRSGEQTGGVQ